MAEDLHPKDLPEPVDSARAKDRDDDGGYSVADESRKPADFPHKGGDPKLDGDAQYGASPLRKARYAEDHEVNAKHFEDGKPRVQPAMHKGPGNNDL